MGSPAQGFRIDELLLFQRVQEPPPAKVPNHSGPPAPPASKDETVELHTAPDHGTSTKAYGSSFPLPGHGFLGVPQSMQSNPPKVPDPSIAVGPPVAGAADGWVVEVVNFGIKFYPKLGSGGSTGPTFLPFSGPGGFLNPQGPSRPFDPRVLYDDYTDRFVVIALESQDWPQPRSWLHLAISDGPDPTGSWNRWVTDLTSNTLGYNRLHGDFPSLGLDRGAVYVGMDLYEFPTNSAEFVGLRYRAFDKQSLVPGSTNATYWDIDEAPAAGTYWAMRAAHVMRASNSSPSVGLFVGARRGQTSTLRLSKMRNPLGQGGTPTLESHDLPVPTYQEPAVDAPQPCAGSRTLDVLAAQLLDARYDAPSGRLVTAHAVRSSNPPLQNVVRWYSLLTGNQSAKAWWAQVEQWGEIDLGAQRHAFNPSININGQGQIAVSFAVSGSGDFPSLWATGRGSCDPPGTMGTPVVLATGNGCFNQTTEPGPNAPARWGDYGQMALDPAVPGDFWAGGEMTLSSEVWGTWIQQLKIVESCPTCLCIDCIKEPPDETNPDLTATPFDGP